MLFFVNHIGEDLDNGWTVEVEDPFDSSACYSEAKFLEALKNKFEVNLEGESLWIVEVNEDREMIGEIAAL